MVAASAQSMSSTKSTVGVVRTWSRTRSVSAKQLPGAFPLDGVGRGGAGAVEHGVGPGALDHREVVGAAAGSREGLGHRAEQ